MTAAMKKKRYVSNNWRNAITWFTLKIFGIKFYFERFIILSERGIIINCV